VPILTDREVSVLAQLAEGDCYGLQLVAGSRGAVSRAAIYVLLGRMKDKGFVESLEETVPASGGESGPPRRLHRATELGLRMLEAHRASMAIIAEGAVDRAR
jgi:DNA-binding PadR family transcriptional regulator